MVQLGKNCLTCAVSTVPFFPVQMRCLQVHGSLETFIPLIVGRCARCPGWVTGYDDNLVKLQYGYFSSTCDALIYKKWICSMRLRNQPALTHLSPTAALVPDLSHGKDDKNPTGGADGVIFVLKC